MERIKKFFKKILSKKIVEMIVQLKSKDRIYFGLKKIDRDLLEFLDYKNGFYIEMGAADGVTQSNTMYYEKNLGWRGLLIEPEINNFNKCKKNRSKNNFFFNKACVGFDYKKKSMQMVSIGLMTTSLNKDLNKISPEIHIKQGEQYLKSDEKIKEFTTEVSTLNDLLKETNSPKIIDFISLDVEGLEFEVLNGINFEEYRFRYILVETLNNYEMINYFQKKKYQLVKEFPPRDLLFKYIF